MVNRAHHVSLGAGQPIFGGLGFEAAAHLGQGAVDQNVEAAELLQNPVVQAVNGVGLADVDLHAMGVMASILQPAGEIQVPLHGTGGHDHRRSGFGQTFRQAAAELGPGSGGHQSDPALEGKLFQHGHGCLSEGVLSVQDLPTVPNILIHWNVARQTG